MTNQPKYWLSLPREGGAIAHLATDEGRVLCRWHSIYRASIAMPEHSKAKTCWECMQSLRKIDPKAYRVFYLSGIGKAQSLAQSGARGQPIPQSLSHRTITKP